MSAQQHPANVGKYLVGKARNGIVPLTFTRDWAAAKSSVVTSLGAATVAAMAIRSGIPAQSVILVADGQDHPNYAVPAVFLKAANIRFRVADNGKAMAARVAVQKAERSASRSFIKLAKQYGFKAF